MHAKMHNSPTNIRLQKGDFLDIILKLQIYILTKIKYLADFMNSKYPIVI